MPEVSVIMPAHNPGTYLREAVRSICRQSFEDWELFVVDDASTDGAVDRLEEEDWDERLQVVRFTKNKGGAAAIMAGVARSRGAFIAIMDSDDRALPHRLEIQAQVMRTNPEIGIVSCEARFIDASGECTGRKPSLYRREDIAGDSHFFFYMLHPGMMIRREMFQEVGYRAEFKYAWDFDFLARAVEKYPVIVLPLELMEYRVHADSIGGGRGVRRKPTTVPSALSRRDGARGGTSGWRRLPARQPRWQRMVGRCPVSIVAMHA